MWQSLLATSAWSGYVRALLHRYSALFHIQKFQLRGLRKKKTPISGFLVSRLWPLTSCLLSLVPCILPLLSRLFSLVSCLLSLVSCLLSLVSFVFGLLSLASKLIPSTSIFKLDLPTPHPSLVNVEVCYPHTLCSSTLDGGGRGDGGWGRDARTRNSNIDVDGRSAEGDGEWGSEARTFICNMDGRFFRRHRY